jgi:cyclophilin family peptidyl-prolyl cis-trans isomerase
MRSASRVCLAVLALAAPFVLSAQDSRIEVVLDLSQEFYYEGDPMTVRISVRNIGNEKTANPIRQPLFGGFVVKSGGAKLEPTGKSAAEEPARPADLAPQSFYGGLINLVDLYPQLNTTGTHEIHWSGDGLVSNALIVTVIPRFDPRRDYTGEIETNYGSIEIELYTRDAPIAVKSFVDLAHAEYYDGLLIHEVQGDSYVMGGDGRFADPPRRPIRFPAEQSTLPLVAGTLVLRPVGPAPPANGSTFVILLRPQPKWTGQVTVLGQVVRGLDVVREISNVPSTMRSSTPNFKPLRDVVIRKVSIREKSPASGG